MSGIEKWNIILEKSFTFSISAIELFRQLQAKNEFILSKQFLRSATSIGANVEEAIGAQSKKDFVHKMSISAKEARETRYWLRLMKQSQLVPIDYDVYLKDIEDILNILIKIVKTSSENTLP